MEVLERFTVFHTPYLTTTTGICFVSDSYISIRFNIQYNLYKKTINLQSSQVKCTPQDSINEFIIEKLNLLLVVDFRFISAFLQRDEP